VAGKRVALTLPPGSKRRATPQDTRGGWWDMSLVRFAGGMLTPIGGWKTLPGVQTNGPVRNLLSWRDLDRLRWVAAASLADIVVWDGATGTVISPGDFVARGHRAVPVLTFAGRRGDRGLRCPFPNSRDTSPVRG